MADMIGCATRAKALVCSPDIARPLFAGSRGLKAFHAADRGEIEDFCCGREIGHVSVPINGNLS